MTEVIDSTALERKFNNLVSREQQEILFKAVKEGAEVLKKYTQESLLSKFPKASTAKGKANRTMVKEVHTGADKAYLTAWVSVLNYLTKWFETGTKSRYLKKTHDADQDHRRTYKKGEHRGAIRPLWFFRDAKLQHADEVTEVIKQAVLDGLKNEFED